MRVVIIGGGPCGLGAAWRLNEIGHVDWCLFEGSDQWGGLAASVQDPEGFWWDLGGHVLFSHYPYFDAVMDALLGRESGWVMHQREAWIWMQQRFIPYPLQNNIHRLPREVFWQCLKGIVHNHREQGISPPADFAQWIENTFGEGLARWFLRPYNYKVWAHTPEEMDWSWVGERVSPVDLLRVLENAVFDRDDISWGPNSMFRFPRRGGTGHIWRSLARRLPPEKMFSSACVERISPRRRRVTFQDGRTIGYDALVSTIPLTKLVAVSELEPPFDRIPDLKHTATHIVGLALNGSAPDHLASKCWIYFPEADCPFYRATVFSNYSPNNVPDREQHWSLMFEVSESDRKPVDQQTVVQDVIQGAWNTKLISDPGQIHHTWHRRLPLGYPVPSLGRDSILLPLLKHLAGLGIHSRGRFGAWRYEVGNMDHSFMQGVECIDALLNQDPELTVWDPEAANAPK